MPGSSKDRRVYDLMAFDTAGGMVDVAVDTDRDESWAVPMEAAIDQHTRHELLALRPDVIWQGARCQRTSCEVTYRAKGLDPAIASVVDTFIFGAGTMISRDTHEDADGLTTYSYRIVYRTPTSSVRLSADQYLARQQPRSAEDEAIYVKLASYLADQRAGREVPP